MLDVDTLLAYARRPNEDRVVAQLIVDLANGVVNEVTGVLNPEPFRVQAIRLEVAARALRNPEGFTSETVDIYTYRREPSRAGVHLTDDERAELQGLTTGSAEPGPWAGSLAYGR